MAVRKCYFLNVAIVHGGPKAEQGRAALRIAPTQHRADPGPFALAPQPRVAHFLQRASQHTLDAHMPAAHVGLAAPFGRGNDLAGADLVLENLSRGFCSVKKAPLPRLILRFPRTAQMLRLRKTV